MSSQYMNDLGRPVMTRDQLMDVGRRVLAMTTGDVIDVSIQHTAQSVTRIADNRILSSDNGDTLSIWFRTSLGGPPVFSLSTNQLDDHTLLAGVRQCERWLHENPLYQPDIGMKNEEIVQDTPVPVHLWHDSTVRAMADTGGAVFSKIIADVTRERLQTAGFLGIIARAEAVIRKDRNLIFFNEETDSELTITAHDPASKALGWSGQAARDWTAINVTNVTQHAIRTAQQSRFPVAVEPGRRTAILTAEAVVQMLRYFSGQFNALETAQGHTGLSKSRDGGTKLRQQVFDSRLSLRSDPDDPEGGYRPYIEQEAVATPPMTWVRDGVLTNLAYSWVAYAMSRGKPYADDVYSFRLSGGTTTVEEMIASCKEGILVNRVADVDLLDDGTCLLTGVTYGGCFLVKDGKINKPVKNFRFVESPFFFLNKIEALGTPHRAAFGYTPYKIRERVPTSQWPRPPIIVPPIMVRDFNFIALSDAV